MFSHEQYDALLSGAGLLDRRNRGRLRLTGSDRRSYLQGLLTNDVAALVPGSGCYAALLTPQGRMISDMRVSELGDAILIDLPGATADAVRQRLADFIFSEDVEVHDVRDTLAHVGVYGPGAARIIEEAVDSQRRDREARPAEHQPPGAAGRLDGLPDDGHTSWEVAGGRLVAIRSRDFGVAGFEVIADSPLFADLIRALEIAGAVHVDPGSVEVTRVEAGVPEFGADMDEHTIPLEAGIEDRAISLSKGCYVGQEIIIRVLHRGQGRVAKRLVGLAGHPDQEVLARGQRLVDAAGSRDVGVVTTGVYSPRLARPIALAYVHRDVAEPGTVVKASEGGSRGADVIVSALPFIAPAAG